MKLLKSCLLPLFFSAVANMSVYAENTEKPKTVEVDMAIVVWHDRPPLEGLTAAQMEAYTLPPDAGSLVRTVTVGNGGTELLNVGEGMSSTTFRYVGPPLMSLFTEHRNEKGEIILNPREQVQLPDDAKSGLLLAIRNGGSDENPHFNLLFLNSSDIAKDDRGILFFNLSQKPIAVRTSGSNPVTIAPRLRQWVALEKQRRTVPLKIAAAHDGGWKVVYNSVNRLPHSGPALGLVLNQPGSKENYRISMISLPARESEPVAEEDPVIVSNGY